jgi:hypothetical protein
MSGVTYIVNQSKELLLVNNFMVGGTASQGYVRPVGVPNGEEIIANAPDYEVGGVTYKPLYYICMWATFASKAFKKSETNRATGGDAFLFSDEPTTLYVGDTTHTFDTTYDIQTANKINCRWAIVYGTAANKADANGITVNIDAYRATFEIIAASGTIFSATSKISGNTALTINNQNLQYVNLENASFYDNTISTSDFLRFSAKLKTLILPASLEIISGSYSAAACYSLYSFSASGLTTISGNLQFSGCYSLNKILLTNITSFENTNSSTLNYAQFIELPENFDINGVNFTGAPGYTKSIEWLNTELPTKLKDNSSGTAKTMTLGAANIALIGTAAAATIAAKNWTIA